MRRLLVSLFLLIAAPARGGEVPSPSNSTVPSLIPVIGFNAGGVADPIGEVTVVHRDLANNPIAGALIRFDFSACTEMRLCADPHDPDAVVGCAQRTVSKITDANGVARFRVVGWSVAAPGTPGAAYNAAKIYADGVQLGSPSVAIYDLTGANGLTSADLSAWLTDFFSGSEPARGDYSNTGSPLGPADLSRWLTAFFANGSILNGPACP
jgi:hypothetical protein